MVEVISVGNELLIGQTLDTNSNWIARQVTGFGWKLRRVTQLADSLDAIKNGVNESLKRKPDLIITVGGLGPTHDDMTLRGLSLAVHRPLLVNHRALEMIRQHYSNMDEPTRLTSYRRKMATLPEGSEPLPNPAGTAPGVLTRSGKTTIVSLPGVPREMKTVFKGSVIPLLRKQSAGRPREANLLLAGIIESALAPILSHAQKRFPGLYFKSHPKGRETGIGPVINLHIYSTEQSSGGKIGDAVAYVLERLSEQERGQPRNRSRGSK